MPSIFKLTNDNIRAQFSFGQGETTVTPLQVSQIVAAIVNGGYFTPLKLIEGVVNEEKKYIEKYKDSKKKKILDKEHADIIKSAMFLVAKEGTAYIPQKSETTNFGAKTGTAQTGKFSRDNEIVNFWYVGFYPYYNPKYTVVILCDNICEAEGSPCDEVFSKVIDFLKEYN